MKLYDICPEAKAAGIEDREINSVTDNTEKLAFGDIFVCIKGFSFDGHLAAADMIKKGAALIVAQNDTGASPQILVSDTRKYFTTLAAAYYGNPQKKAFYDSRYRN